MDNHTPTSEAKPTFRTAEEYERAIREKRKEELRRELGSQWTQAKKDIKVLPALFSSLLCIGICALAGWSFAVEGVNEKTLLFAIFAILLCFASRKINSGN